MFGRSSAGFTLIEILVAIFIVGIMATVLIPNLRSRNPKAERNEVIAQLNMLTSVAWSNALITSKVHQVYLDIAKKRFSLRMETDKKDSQGQTVFEPTTAGGYSVTSFTMPKNLEIKNFYVEGFDEMNRFEGQTTKDVWFFVVPAGLAQEVTINMLDTNDRKAGKPAQIGLVLNPFLAQFKDYDSFQK